MRKNAYWIDPAEPLSAEPLIDAVNARAGQFERAIRAAIGTHKRPFTVFIDYLNRPPEPSPMFDPFTFDMETDELIVLSDEPSILVDALLEMAMFMRGFNTLIGVDADWKIQVAIGAWRRVRETLKQALGLPHLVGQVWLVTLNADGVTQFDAASFTLAVTLAGCYNIEVKFPEGTAPRVVTTYRYLTHVLELIGHSVSLDDQVMFNRRLNRAVSLIEEHLAPEPDSDNGTPDLPDNLFGDLPF